MKNVLLYVFYFFSVSFYGQHFSGIVTYTGVINQKYVDSFLTDLNQQQDVPMNIKQGVADWYLNAGEDEYFLHFNDGESYYYHNPTLAQQESYDIGSKAGTNPFYTRSATNTIIESSKSLGNIAHEPLDWQLVNQSKIIGGYTCYKAVATERLYSRKGFFYNKQVIAWYAPELPLNFGPKYYNGLPGLILQIERDMFTLTATQVELNPNDKKLRIDRITDKVIDQEEAVKRIQEMTAQRQRNE